MNLVRHVVAAGVVAVAALLTGSHATARAAEPAVVLAGGEAATAQATVTVEVRPPTGTESMLRVSNDAGATWIERTYATSFAWSLVDVAAGGVDMDGPKSVTVQAGIGDGSWVPLGSDEILLDRAGPVVSGLSGQGNDNYMQLYPDVSDAGVGVQRTELSMDGIHWHWLNPQPWSPDEPNRWDPRDATIGGSPDPVISPLYVRGVDRLGNVGESFVGTAGGVQSPDNLVRFHYPHPAVVGERFTIEPVWKDGVTLEADWICNWSFVGGDERARLGGEYNETMVRVDFNVPVRNGRCESWTFTVPYTPALEYTVVLSVNDVNEWKMSTVPMAGSFRADPGLTTSPAVTYSSLPLYYIVPDDLLADAQGVITYRLHRAGGAPERTGTWNCQPAEIPYSPYAPEEQRGGTSFRCHVNLPGPWEADWITETKAGRSWRAAFDPIGDRRKPVVTTPRIAAAPGRTPTASAVPVELSWSGHDRGTGIGRFQLQRSVNGGVWRDVTLASKRARATSATLDQAKTYRFRVRARDRAGNWSPWATTTNVRPSLKQQTSRAWTWSTGWSTRQATTASGGSVRSATARGSAATLRFTGRAVGWVARRAPGQGFAQVYVDGALVATVSLEATSQHGPAVIWRKSWGSSASHTVRIKVLGTSGRPAVEVDGTVVLR